VLCGELKIEPNGRPSKEAPKRRLNDCHGGLGPRAEDEVCIEPQDNMMEWKLG